MFASLFRQDFPIHVGVIRGFELEAFFEVKKLKGFNIAILKVRTSCTAAKEDIVVVLFPDILDCERTIQEDIVIWHWDWDEEVKLVEK